MTENFKHPIFKWDLRFLALSKVIAGMSKDPSTQVGSVIVRPDKTIASMGFNGLPRGVKDTDERLNDRRFKYPMVVHAEANALASAKEPVRGYTLYCTHPPCASCAGLIIQHGIKEVFTLNPSQSMIERWGDSFEFMKLMFREAGVHLLFVPLSSVTEAAEDDLGLSFIQEAA